MRLLAPLQDRFGFTRSEVTVLLILAGTFLGGLGVRWWSNASIEHATPAFDYAVSDSVFDARSRISMPTVDGTHPSFPSGPTKLNGTYEPVDINTAGKADLVKLPGIGPGLAGRIIEYRTTNGRFADVDALAGVKGIGSRKLAALRRFIVAR